MFDKRIVAIHSISDFTFTQKRLIKYIETMKSLGYQFVSLEDILSKDSKGKLISLTVDDGYKSCIYHLIPVLEQYNIPALMFLPSQLLGLKANHPLLTQHECYEDESTMGVDDVNFWISKGFGIGFHTGMHLDLYQADDQAIEMDFRQGMKVFQENGWKTPYFAYPKGFLPRNKKFFEHLLQAYGIKYAFTIRWGTVDVNNPFYINRVCLGNHENFLWSILKTLGVGDYYFKKRRLTIEQL